MFVILLTYTKPIEEMDKLRPAHLEFLNKYYEDGTLLASGRQVPLKGGCIIAHAASRAEIERILAEDPFAIEGAATYEIIEFTPSRVVDALKPLLERHAA